MIDVLSRSAAIPFPLPGIRPKDLDQAWPREVVQAWVKDLVTGRVLVGHALHNDLEVRPGRAYGRGLQRASGGCRACLYEGISSGFEWCVKQCRHM